MGLESGTWIEDLVVTNPTSTDSKSQGDDHITLIKRVLKNSLKRTSGRPVYFPTTVSLVANYTVLDTDENTIFRCSTTAGAFSITLPNTLTTANAGWKIIVVKTNPEANPVFIVPPTGALDGFTKVRRTQENKATEVMWTGSGWVVTRPNNAPIGTVHEYYGQLLPNGHLWPDGGTFVAADFAELFATLGVNTKPDLRGRGSFGRDDMGSVAAGRITSGGSGIVGTTLKATGGTETHTLTTAQLATHNHTISGTHSHGPGSLGTDDGSGSVPSSVHSHPVFIRDPTHAHTIGNAAVAGSSAAGGSGGNAGSGVVLTTTGSIATSVRTHPLPPPIANQPIGQSDATATAGPHTHFVNAGVTDAISAGPTDNNGSGTAHQNMPPSIVCNKIIVAE
jgi:microcystin-dependent protein